MKRYIEQKLCDWKNSPSRKPLLLMGARQVGKTYCLKQLGERHYQNTVYLNFESMPGLASLFAQKLQPSEVIPLLEIEAKQTIDPLDTLLIFDEIQASPEALNSLKYFQEHAPDYHVCAAGSLLGVALEDRAGFPVGKVDFMSLQPMCFFEFLEAIGEEKLSQFLQALDVIRPLPDTIHNTLSEYFKYYMYIGGMPEAVLHYREHRNLAEVRDRQQAILNAYALDFSKHASPNALMTIQQVWEGIPSQLAKENKKFIYSAIRKGARAKQFEGALAWLQAAGLINRVARASKPALPLKAYSSLDAFKIYCFDTGLLSAMSGLSAQSVIHEPSLLEEFKGALAENYCAQVLRLASVEHAYWASDGRAEIDFIIQQPSLGIVPMEVKSGTSNKKKSLKVYQQKFHPKSSLRVGAMNLKQEDGLINLPLYLMDLLHRGSLVDL